MPTATNSIIYLYKGVPLLKGGTEVLYVYQDNAITQLEPFLHRTFFQYYYVREERQYVRIKVTMPEVEGCNYLAFRNPSNGNKWFFGFIDRLVYLNDNTVEIEFTIDQFPTYLGDCTTRENVFIIRNTPKIDSAAQYLQNDYLPDSVKDYFITNVSYSVPLTKAEVYCTCGVSLGAHIDGLNNISTGIQVTIADPQTIDLIKQHGGDVIGMYMFPTGWFGDTLSYPAVIDLGDTTFNPFEHVPSVSYQKIRSGVYCKLLLTTPQAHKFYDIEQFSNRESVTFGKLGLIVPSPMCFIYPKNYKGVEHNLAEGVFMQAPSLPITANSVYTDLQSSKDAFSMFASIGSGAGMGFQYGGIPGAVAGAAVGGMVSAINAGIHQYQKQFEGKHIIANGMPVVLHNGNMTATFTTVTPDVPSLYKIEKYFDYFGYNIGSFNTALNPINTDDGAYLQTGNEMLAGSEVDVELNERIMSGIKIRRTLSQGA